MLIHTSNPENHLILLKLVIEAHREAGIKLNAEKSFLFSREVRYLGRLVSEDGINLLQSYVDKITQWPLPTTGKELLSFLGFAGYYREFLPGFAEVTENLNEVKNKQALSWTEEMINNYNTLSTEGEQHKEHTVTVEEEIFTKNQGLVQDPHQSSWFVILMIQVWVV